MAKQATIRQLDKVFSEYVRRRHARFDDKVECFTCSRLVPWQHMDAGHFMPRACLSTRYDMKNVQPQCRVCNRHNSGERERFAIELDRVFGMGTAEHLHVRSKRLAVMSELHALHMLEHYKKKLQELQHCAL